jgi:hypothetical protein
MNGFSEQRIWRGQDGCNVAKVIANNNRNSRDKAHLSLSIS